MKLEGVKICRPVLVTARRRPTPWLTMGTADEARRLQGRSVGPPGMIKDMATTRPERAMKLEFVKVADPSWE
jgi:hypothetical protein